MTDQAKLVRARKRIQELRGFYQHLAAYLFVNVLAVVANLMSSPQKMWCQWLIIGWGLGLGLHAFTVYSADLLWGSSWESRKMKELLDQDESKAA